MRMRIAAAAALVAAAGLAAPQAAAQEQPRSVFQQPVHGNPFTALLYGRPAVSGYSTAELGNNTLELGDVFALAQLRSDLRPTDLFLVGGLVPRGEGAQLGGRGDAVLTVAGLPSPYGIFGIQVGAHAISKGLVPDDVARLAREGATGQDTLRVNLSGFAGRALSYSSVGLLGLWDVPVAAELNPHLPPVTMQVGAGVRYLHGIGYSSFHFSGADGVSPAIASTSHEGIDTNVLFARSLDFASRGGTGLAADFFVNTTFGQRLVVNGLIGDVGRIRARGGEMEVRQLVTQGATIRQFVDALDEVDADTVALEDRTSNLPARARMEVSYALSPRLATGVALDYRRGREFGVNPRMLTAQAEYLPLSWLPLRAALTLGGDFGMAGSELGFGLRFRDFLFDASFGAAGGPLPDAYRGGAFRTGLVVLF